VEVFVKKCGAFVKIKRPLKDIFSENEAFLNTFLVEMRLF
jgi:hypothetical protein